MRDDYAREKLAAAIESDEEGSIEATARTMSDDQAKAMAREIVGLVTSYLYFE